MRYTLVDRNRLARFLIALVGAVFLGVIAHSTQVHLKAADVRLKADTTAFAAAADATPPSFTAAQRDWWSLKPVATPAVPEVKNRQWVKNPIDAFVLASLEAKGLTPNPAADRVTLLRRASIDITGLPPTEEAIAQFVNDKSPTAWAKVVDRLLASPQYGERWGRHWLDIARYADSNGFKADETRPHIWRYRDYVIEAFNKDKPYDRFVREQIAGDELYPGEPEALIAMGFNRHWIDETNAAGLMTRRQETLDDMTNVTGATFLGLTVACARCHDHKTDPILHTDYYRLQAFFANTSFGDGPLPPADPIERKAYAEQKATWEEKTTAIRAEMETILEPLRRSRMMGGIKTFEDEVQAAILKDPDKRDVSERMMFHTASPRITFDEEPDARTLRSLKGDAATRFNELKKQLAEFDSIRPRKLLEGQFMTDIGREAPPVYTLKNGNWQAKGTLVQPGFLQILDSTDAKITPPVGVNSTGRRSALAEWLTDPKNPLPARVMVNRIWHYHFGRGIVSTPGDFGRMGATPTHPELLDYMASTFVDGGWRMKALHRMILLSNTYQQSSATQEAAAKVDPDNKLLWRYNRHRMEAEAVRDSMLFVSGRLNPQMGGPGVFPKVPRGVLTELSATAAAGGWSTEKDPAQMNRRSVYIFVRRNLRYPMLQAFDNANSFESAHARTSSVTAAQALDLLNDELINEWAAAFAERVKGQEATAGTPAQVTRAYKLVYGRDATPEEQKAAAAFFESQSKTAGTRAKALVDFSHALLASNEFLYVN